MYLFLIRNTINEIKIQFYTKTLQLQLNVVFEAKSVKQIFDIWTNINDDYKIIDGVLKNLLLHLKQETVGRKIVLLP